LKLLALWDERVVVTCRAQSPDWARIETPKILRRCGCSMVAPSLRTGRGLKTQRTRRHTIKLTVAPSLRTGRGLKPSRRVVSRVACRVAPSLETGRGLKHLN